jgi:2'-5' RNA ligase
MRLFVALDLSDSVKDRLTALVDSLRSSARIRWTRPSNLHLTTKFIGEWPEERLEELKTALETIESPPITIAVRGLGWFPNPHHPRIFWAAVRAPESLPALARATDATCSLLGIAPETRPYSPHLTLARIEEKPDLGPLRRRIASLDTDEWGEFTASEFHLYLSQLQPGGSVYSKLASFPMNGPQSPEPSK